MVKFETPNLCTVDQILPFGFFLNFFHSYDVTGRIIKRTPKMALYKTNLLLLR